MKLSKHLLVTLIEEVLEESFGKQPSPWVKGNLQGNRDATRLARKKEKQTAKGLEAYIKKATENHPNAEWREGYRFAFQLMFSAQLTPPPSDGQLPFSGAKKPPSWLFDPRLRRKRRWNK